MTHLLVARAEDPDGLRAARAAIAGGHLVIVPTDTVYGIACDAWNEDACGRLASAKDRDPRQPVAVLFASVRSVLEALPGLSARARRAIDVLLPGPWTLVVANPDGRAPWLTGGVPAAIGVRVPAGALELPPLAATSANLHGAPAPVRFGDIDPSLRRQAAVALDAGEIGSDAAASTVLDITGWEAGGDVVVLRDDANRAASARSLLSSAT